MIGALGESQLAIIGLIRGVRGYIFYWNFTREKRYLWRQKEERMSGGWERWGGWKED